MENEPELSYHERGRRVKGAVDDNATKLDCPKCRASQDQVKTAPSYKSFL